jgi:isoquinoline 1-oxidoreductase beta subunit
VEYTLLPSSMPRGWWRSVSATHAVFAIESFIDELARKANMDPVAFRLGMLDGTPRLKAALKLVAEKSGWSSPLPTRVGRGVCAQPSFGSFIATVVEAEVDDVGGVHLRRITCAVDTGIAVNPDTIMAQLQGGLIFGLTAALWGEVTIEKGRVAANILAASARQALPPARPPCATRSMRQPACPCAVCQSIVPRLQ